MKLFMTVDFFDDMIPMEWDRERLRRFMEMNAAMGVQRVSWVYHGDREDGFWENTGMPWRENYLKTFETLGDPYLKAAVEEAHSAGMEIFAIYKPFDLAFQNFPTRDQAKSGGMSVAGGALGCAFDFVAKNPDALMERRNIEKIPAARIILNSAEKLAPDHPFRLWESDDNWTYRPLGEIVHPAADGFSVVFDIAGRTAKFFAIESLSPGDVANRLGSIIDVEAADGRPVRRALGIVPRQYRTTGQKFHLGHAFDIGDGFSNEGFFFDYQPGIPSAVPVADKCLERVFSLTGGGQNVIGVSLEINRYVPGAPEPAEPKAVAYWLEMIKKTLDLGVDGVDIRVTNHNSVLDWAEYGFNRPVIEAYRKRYGVNPRTETFDPEKLRRLRGEFYTAFLEKAAALTKGAGRKFCSHIPDMAFGSPSRSTMMEIHWDWQGWLDKGLPDEVTFKTIDKDSVFSVEARDLIARCRARGIPVSACPFLHAIPDLSAYLKDVEALGVDAFAIYESATLWAANPNGFTELKPAFNEIIRQKFHHSNGG